MAAAIICVVLLVGAIVFLNIATQHNKELAVPDFKGMTVVEAQAAAEAANAAAGAAGLAQIDATAALEAIGDAEGGLVKDIADNKAAAEFIGNKAGIVYGWAFSGMEYANFNRVDTFMDHAQTEDNH